MKIDVEVYDSIVFILNFETHCRSLAVSQNQVGPDSAVLVLRFLLKIRSVRILDTLYVLVTTVVLHLQSGMMGGMQADF